MKEKGKKPENWNWQVRQRKYGDDDPVLERHMPVDLFDSPVENSPERKPVYLLRSATGGSDQKITRSKKFY